MAIIRELAELIDFKSPVHKVDLKNPKITIAIEVIKGLCCFSLLPDYYKLKKYNVFELTQTKEEKPVVEKEKDETPADGDKTDEKPADEVQKDGNSVDEPQKDANASDDPKKDEDSVDEPKPTESGDVNPYETAEDEVSGEQ